MSATVYGFVDDQGTPIVGADCDGCHKPIIHFDSVAFGSERLAVEIEKHEPECIGNDDG